MAAPLATHGQDSQLRLEMQTEQHFLVIRQIVVPTSHGVLNYDF
jgi:hypothetical protein